VVYFLFWIDCIDYNKYESDIQKGFFTKHKKGGSKRKKPIKPERNHFELQITQYIPAGWFACLIGSSPLEDG
jgi:hypothetical protein